MWDKRVAFCNGNSQQQWQSEIKQKKITTRTGKEFACIGHSLLWRRDEQSEYTLNVAAAADHALVHSFILILSRFRSLSQCMSASRFFCIYFFPIQRVALALVSFSRVRCVCFFFLPLYSSRSIQRISRHYYTIARKQSEKKIIWNTHTLNARAYSIQWKTLGNNKCPAEREIPYNFSTFTERAQFYIATVCAVVWHNVTIHYSIILKENVSCFIYF